MTSTEITIPIDGIQLAGTLTIPAHAIGLVIFAHGSGSSRHSPRNRHVAQILQSRGVATLLFDLLTEEEEQFDAIDMTLRFDVDMLAERLVEATDSVVANGTTQGLPVAYFGGSTGAAAALIAAARRPALVSAVVSRGGRPDLATAVIAEVRAPTLLIVGGNDKTVLAMNRSAADKMRAPHRIEVVPGASHLFEEPGTLDQVARLAAGWFVEQFTASHAAAS